MEDRNDVDEQVHLGYPPECLAQSWCPGNGLLVKMGSRLGNIATCDQALWMTGLGLWLTHLCNPKPLTQGLELVRTQ